MTDERKMWSNNERIDKPHLSVTQGTDGDWHIQINGHTIMSHCPCCMKTFAKREHAMRCVDVFWPADRGIDIGS